MITIYCYYENSVKDKCTLRSSIASHKKGETFHNNIVKVTYPYITSFFRAKELGFVLGNNIFCNVVGF